MSSALYIDVRCALHECQVDLTSVSGGLDIVELLDLPVSMAGGDWRLGAGDWRLGGGWKHACGGRF